jgi:hypothetical protein
MTAAELASNLGRHGTAVAELRREFADAGSDLWRLEIAGSYSFITDVSTCRLAKIASLAAHLTPASYEVTLHAEVDEWQADFMLTGSESVVAQRSGEDSDAAWPRVESNLLEAFEKIKALAEHPSTPMAAFTATIEELDAAATAENRRLVLQVNMNLNKASVAEDIEGMSDASPKVVFWLFPEALSDAITTQRLQTVTGWVTPLSRTVIVVVGMRGALEGDVLSVFGGTSGSRSVPEHFDALFDTLRERVPAATRTTFCHALKFRDEHCVWLPETKRVVPGSLAVLRVDAAGDDVTQLAATLERMQALLALAFVANRTEFLDAQLADIMLTFKGQATRGVTVSVADTNDASREQLEDVMALYKYAYDAESVDKLEVVRQMMALAVDSGATVFSKAADVRKASESAHATYLRGAVAEYFGALKAVQDHVQKVVSDAEGAAIALSRDAADRFFKVLGIVAAAVVAAALKTELEDLAGLMAAVVIMFYVGLSIRYYLCPLRQSALALKTQACNHIKAFSDVIGEEKAQELMTAPGMEAAWQRYTHERRLAAGLLWFVFVVASVVAVVFALRIYGFFCPPPEYVVHYISYAELNCSLTFTV